MARPVNRRVSHQREAVGHAGSWWRVVVVCFVVVTIGCVIFLLHQNGYLFSTSITPEGSTSGESPDKASCHHYWPDLCKDLQKARKDANDYFHSQVLMRVQHRLPMDNGTLYSELQGLKAEALYRFRKQIGDKDVTGQVWDELEVDLEKTILNLIHLNLMIAKENNKKDRQTAAVRVEIDCDNITDSDVKVVCLDRRLKMFQSQEKEDKAQIEMLEKHAKEQRKREEGLRRIMVKERARRNRVDDRVRLARTFHRWQELENKLKQGAHREPLGMEHLPDPPNDSLILILAIVLLTILLYYVGSWILRNVYLKDIWITFSTLFITLVQFFLQALVTMIRVGVVFFYSLITPATEYESSDGYIYKEQADPPSSDHHGPKADLFSSDPHGSVLKVNDGPNVVCVGSSMGDFLSAIKMIFPYKDIPTNYFPDPCVDGVSYITEDGRLPSASALAISSTSLEQLARQAFVCPAANLPSFPIVYADLSDGSSTADFSDLVTTRYTTSTTGSLCVTHNRGYTSYIDTDTTQKIPFVDPRHSMPGDERDCNRTSLEQLARQAFMCPVAPPFSPSLNLLGYG